ncbi:hypothetical protein SAMN05444505_111220 [Pseudomonas syringae]|uniref:Uncharacterized protein n=1 Tax=Pseudomonas syringae TaxID=317 RepID=A0AB37ZSI6_PSESX|nr:hypothetical protein SAMN05444505_111220 [Pseudomonas syringae]
MKGFYLVLLQCYEGPAAKQVCLAKDKSPFPASSRLSEPLRS